MASERWAQVESLLHATLSQPTAQRANFLREACDGDEALQRDVESLMGRESAAADFLESPAPFISHLAVSAVTAALVPGQRLGPYVIVARLGAGGMGEVYRARDTELKRDVALKVLPAALAGDTERLARFRREAEVLASLNHPNIASIYGLAQGSGITALVMELVEGEDLSQRIARGATPIEDALPIAKQIAEALESAHERGIIHRDLKPANIKLRDDGMVKVLDFGLAKAMFPASTAGPAALLPNSPTIASPADMTGIGVLLGTAAYMSPEQAKGLPADKRSDVWAFGCVLYEVLSGRRAFGGDDVADTLAMVLRGEVDLSALPESVPPTVRDLIRGCLRKERKERIGDISTASFVLRQPFAARSIVRQQRQLFPRTAALIVAGAVLGAAITAAGVRRREPSPAPVTRFSIALPPGKVLTFSRRALALSPDGSRLVYVADGGLYVRRLSDFEARPIAGAEVAATPTFSPDGESIAFYNDSAIKRIAVSGGTAVTICRVSIAPASMTWTREGLLFSDNGGNSIARVSPDGGNPEVLVDLTKSNDLAFTPQLLPDGDTLLFSMVSRSAAANGRWDTASVVAQSMKTGVRTRVLKTGGDAVYAKPGYILYVSGGTLFAAAFDAAALAVTGPTVPVVEGLRMGTYPGPNLGGRTGHFAVSDAGTLAYVSGPSTEDQQYLMRFDQKGSAEPLTRQPGRYEFPRTSPDGKRIAFGTADANDAAIWIYELSGGSAPIRLTFGGNNRFPVWSANGERVVFQSDREGDLGLFWQKADGSAPAERLTRPAPGTSHVPESASPKGDVLLFSASASSLGSLWTLSLHDRTTALFSKAKDLYLPPDATFSPNGRWVAYQVGEPTLSEGRTYIEPFPPTGTMFLVSQGGRPLWSPDGRQLYLVPGAGRLMVVNVQTEPTVRFSNPVPVVRGFGLANPTGPRTFDMLLDGRIVGLGSPNGAAGSNAVELRVVFNWFEELKRLVPTK